MTDHVKCLVNILTSGLGCGEKGRKEGWKEEEEEGSLKDKSVPNEKKKVHIAHTGCWNLERRLFIFLDKEPGRLNMNGLNKHSGA